jgi:hypothetical protein
MGKRQKQDSTTIKGAMPAHSTSARSLGLEVEIDLVRPRTADQAKRTKASEEFSKIYNQRTEFMKEDRTGFVWLYLQK